MGTERTRSKGSRQLTRRRDVLHNQTSHTPVIAAPPRQSGYIPNFPYLPAQKAYSQAYPHVN